MQTGKEMVEKWRKGQFTEEDLRRLLAHREYLLTILSASQVALNMIAVEQSPHSPNVSLAYAADVTRRAMQDHGARLKAREIAIANLDRLDNLSSVADFTDGGKN